MCTEDARPSGAGGRASWWKHSLGRQPAWAHTSPPPSILVTSRPLSSSVKWGQRNKAYFTALWGEYELIALKHLEQSKHHAGLRWWDSSLTALHGNPVPTWPTLTGIPSPGPHIYGSWGNPTKPEHPKVSQCWETTRRWERPLVCPTDSSSFKRGGLFAVRVKPSWNMHVNKSPLWHLSKEMPCVFTESEGKENHQRWLVFMLFKEKTIWGNLCGALKNRTSGKCKRLWIRSVAILRTFNYARKCKIF